MSVKYLVTSLAGSIDATFLAEAVKSYCETLHQGATPVFSQLQMMVSPEGWCQNNDKKWYRPWTRTSYTPASPTLTDGSRDPVLRLANAQQAPPIDSGDGQETLLGYKWDCKRDLLSTNKASVMTGWQCHVRGGSRLASIINTSRRNWIVLWTVVGEPLERALISCNLSKDIRSWGRAVHQYSCLAARPG